jgi:hypothetical protein
VPSRPVSDRLRLRIHDGHIEAYLGGSFPLSLPRGRRPKGAGAVHVHPVIATLRAKPGALANLAYRDALWPRTAYRRAWDTLSAVGPVHDAARTMVCLLALAHDRGVEADLAVAIDDGGTNCAVRTACAKQITPSRGGYPARPAGASQWGPSQAGEVF